jgi:CRISPR-associated endonuclease Cas2
VEALAGQVDAVVLVGAQAVYLRTQDAELSTQVYTADGDLALDPKALADEPRLEQAMRSAGFFQQPAGSRQPGQWYRTAAGLQQWGDRVQCSVFVCGLEPDGLREVLDRLAAIIDPDADSVYAFRQCAACWDGVRVLGQATVEDEPPFWAIL